MRRSSGVGANLHSRGLGESSFARRHAKAAQLQLASKSNDNESGDPFRNILFPDNLVSALLGELEKDSESLKTSSQSVITNWREMTN